MSVSSHTVDSGSRAAAVRLGLVLPNANVLFADVELSEFVVGNAAFHLRPDFDLPHLLCRDALAALEQLVLLDHALLAGDEVIKLPGLAALVHAQTVGFDCIERCGRYSFQSPRCGIDSVD